MDRETIITIMEEMLFVSDEWGGSKLAEWRWGSNVVIDGIEDTADAIIAVASQQPTPRSPTKHADTCPAKDGAPVCNCGQPRCG